MTIEPKLADAQLTILAAACQRDDRHVLPIPQSVRARGGAIGNVLRSLIRKRLIETVPATAADTIWTHDDEGVPLTLRATTLALDTLGIEPEPHEIEDDNAVAADEAPTAADGAEMAEPAGDATTEDEAAPEAPAAPRVRRPRTDSKQYLLITMLRRPEGASIAEIADAFGWTNHTVRGVIAGALKKKLGLAVTSEKDDQRGRIYRIAREG